jgi:hypothetical protein
VSAVTERWPRLVALGATGAALFGGLLVAVFMARPALHLDMGAGGELDRPLATGFHDPELDETGASFRWTSERATLRLTGLDRRIGWRLRVRLRAPRPPSSVLPELGIDVDGQTRQRAPAPPTYTEIVADLPAREPSPRITRIDLVTSAVFVPGPQDPRQLGVQIDSIALEAAPGARPMPPLDPVWMALAGGAVLGVVLALLDLPLAITVALLALAVLNEALLVRGTVLFLPFPQINLRVIAGLALVAAVATALARRLARAPLAIETRMLAAVWLVLTWVKVALILHPAMFVGDIGFHRNRLIVVERGTWLFTSESPGGAFPYPVAYYVLVSWIDTLVRNGEVVLRLVAASADAALCGLAYPILVRLGVDRRRALGAAVALLLTPALFHIQVVAFLANAFGNVMSAFALLAVATPAGGAMAAGQLIIGFALTLVALLSHLSAAVMLTATLGVLGFVLIVSGSVTRQANAVRNGLAILLLTMAAAGAAFAIYYVHFMPTLGEAWRRGGQASAAPSPDAAPPVQRIEPHQTRFAPGRAALLSRLAAVPRYTLRSYGAPLLLLATWGAVDLWRRRRVDGLAHLLGPWLGVCVTFFVLAMLTPIDLRYYLAAAPALAVLAGAGLGDLLDRPPVGRAVGALLGVWLLVHGLWHDFSWLA